jgi:hypothetical protein
MAFYFDQDINIAVWPLPVPHVRTQNAILGHAKSFRKMWFLCLQDTVNFGQCPHERCYD